MKRVIVLLLAMMLCACVEPPKKDSLSLLMDKWVGLSADDLVASNGTPTNVFMQDSGGRVFEYYKDKLAGGSKASSKVYIDPGFAPDMTGLRKRAPVRKGDGCRILFNVAGNNIIQSWSQEGDSCD